MPPKNSRGGLLSKNSHTMFRTKNSREPDASKNSQQAGVTKNLRGGLVGGGDGTTDDDSTNSNPGTTESNHDGDHSDGNHGNPDGAAEGVHGGNTGDLEQLRRHLDELRRQQRKAIARGVAVVVLPPLLLCLPFIILKGCNLLLIPWGWCFAPLALYLYPAALFARAYAAVRAFREQRVQRDDSPDAPGAPPEGANSCH